jgi:Putative zinc-finger
MKCERIETSIALYLEGDLRGSKIRSVEEHLRCCARCREFAEGLRASQAMLRSLGGEPMAVEALQGVRARVLNDIAAGRAGAPERRVWTRWRMAAAAALAGLLILAGESMLRRHSKAPVPGAPEVTAIPKSAGAPSVRYNSEAPGKAVRSRPRMVAARRRARHNQALTAAARNRQKPQPLVVKLLTNDPNVVIYWLID